MAATQATIFLNVVGRDFASNVLRGIAGIQEGVAERLMRTGRAMTMAVTVPVMMLGGAAGRTTVEFEKTMKQIEVVGGITGEALRDVQDIIIQTSRETVFGANEIARAVFDMARAGIQTADVIGKVLPAAVHLAAVGEMELDDAVDATIRALKMYNARWEDATRISDTYAKVAAISTATVEDLIEGMKNLGPFVAGIGISFEEAARMLGIYADMGVAGATAGTRLRRMLTNLNRDTKAVKQAWEELGISMYDAQGKFRGWRTILQDLQQALYGTIRRTYQVGRPTKKMIEEAKKAKEKIGFLRREIELLESRLLYYGGRLNDVSARYGPMNWRAERLKNTMTGMRITLDKKRQALAKLEDAIRRVEQPTITWRTEIRRLTQEERDHYMQVLAGSHGVAALRAMLIAGTEAWDEYEGREREAATAAEQATAIMDTFWGALKRIRASLDALSIKTMGPLLNKYLKPLAIRIREIIDEFNNLDPRVRETSVVFFGLAAMVGPLALGLGHLLSVLRLLTSPLNLLGILAAGLAAVWITNFGDIRGETRRLRIALREAGLPTSLAEIWDTLDKGGRPIGRLTQMVDRFTNAVRTLVSDLRPAESTAEGMSRKMAKLERMTEEVTRGFVAGTAPRRAFLKFFREGLGLPDELSRELAGLAAGLMEVGATFRRDGIVAGFQELWQVGREHLPRLWGLAETALRGLWKTFQQLDWRQIASDWAAELMGLGQRAGEALASIDWTSLIRSTIERVGEALTSALARIDLDAIEEGGRKVGDALARGVAWAGEMLAEVTEHLTAPLLEAGLRIGMRFLWGLLQGIWGQRERLALMLLRLFHEALDAVARGIVAIIEYIGPPFAQAARVIGIELWLILSGTVGRLKWILGWVAYWGRELWRQLIYPFQVARERLGELVDRFKELGADLAEAIVDGLVGGLSDLWDKVMTEGSNLFGGLRDRLMTIWGAGSPSRVAEQLGRDIGTGFLLGLREQQQAIEAAMRGLMQPSLAYVPAPIGAGVATTQNIQLGDVHLHAAAIYVREEADLQRIAEYVIAEQRRQLRFAIRR